MQKQTAIAAIASQSVWAGCKIFNFTEDAESQRYFAGFGVVFCLCC